MSKNDELFDFVYNECKYELQFNELEPDPDKTYKILIKNFNNRQYKKISSHSTYVVFEGYLLEGFEELGYRNDILCDIDFPIPTFKKGWTKFQGQNPINKHTIYDVEITYKRVTRKKTVFENIRIITI